MLIRIQVLTLAFLALQLSNLVQLFLVPSDNFDLNLFSKAVSCLAAFVFSVLSIVEHRKSTTPSTLLLLYILSSLLGHCVETLVLPSEYSRQALYFLTLRTSLELAVLASESQSKEDILLPEYERLSPEEREGLLGRALFWWINPILLRGYRTILADADLPLTGIELSSKRLRQKTLQYWDSRGMIGPTPPMSSIND